MTLTTALIILGISFIGAVIQTCLWEWWTAYSRRNTILMLEKFHEQIEEARLILNELQLMSDERKLFSPGWQRDNSSVYVQNVRSCLASCENSAQIAEKFLNLPHHIYVVRARRHLKGFMIQLDGSMLHWRKAVNESKIQNGKL